MSYGILRGFFDRHLHVLSIVYRIFHPLNILKHISSLTRFYLRLKRFESSPEKSYIPSEIKQTMANGLGPLKESQMITINNFFVDL